MRKSVPVTERVEPSGVYFVVGKREPPVKLGYVWRIWAGGTSFYLKPRDPRMGAAKLSLHGQHPEGRQPGFRLALDGSPADDLAIVEVGNFLPRWFPGRPWHAGASHVVRLRWTWDLFDSAVPSGPAAGDVRASMSAFVAPPPSPGYAVDLDLYVWDRQPAWPGEAAARKDNAVLGPIRNAADQYLVGLIYRRAVPTNPAPPLAYGPPPTSAEDTVRGHAACLDDQGFMWVIEQRMSRSAMQAARTTPRRLAT